MKIERVIIAVLFVVATAATVAAVDRDLTGQVTVYTSIRPKALTTATHTGSTVDLGSFGACRMYFSVGAWTNGTHTLTFEKSNNNSAWSACTNADFIGTATTVVVDGTPDQNTIYAFEYGGTARYLRAKCVSGSAAAGVPGTAFMVLGYPKNSTVGATKQ